MKKKLFILSGFVFGLAPVVAFAQLITTGASSNCDVLVQGANTQNTLFTLLCKFGQLLNSVVPVLIALGVVYFAYGVISYVIGDDEEAKKKGRNRIIYGIIGLAVIIGLWGLVNLLRNTFGLNNQQQIQVPTVPITIPGNN